MDDEEEFSRLNFGFLVISFKNLFFPKFELLNSGCGLSAGFFYGKLACKELCICIVLMTVHFLALLLLLKL